MTELQRRNGGSLRCDKGNIHKMPCIVHRKIKLFYTIKPKQRAKTITIRVDHHNGINVSVSKTVRKSFIRDVIKKKAEWILEKQSYFQQLLYKNPPKDFVNGETFPLLGRNYRLKLVRMPDLREYSCNLYGKRILVGIDGQVGDALKEMVKRTVQQWYLHQTEEKVRESIQKYSSVLGLIPRSIKVVHQAKRWASCSKSGNLRFNWMISMMPISVLNYVVVHELCHIKIHNHSPTFWRTLKSILPDYENHREWLRENGLRLTLMYNLN